VHGRPQGMMFSQWLALPVMGASVALWTAQAAVGGKPISEACFLVRTSPTSLQTVLPSCARCWPLAGWT
jgi:hypothetical protein